MHPVALLGVRNWSQFFKWWVAGINMSVWSFHEWHVINLPKSKSLLSPLYYYETHNIGTFQLLTCSSHVTFTSVFYEEGGGGHLLPCTRFELSVTEWSKAFHATWHTYTTSQWQILNLVHLTFVNAPTRLRGCFELLVKAPWTAGGITVRQPGCRVRQGQAGPPTGAPCDGERWRVRHGRGTIWQRVSEWVSEWTGESERADEVNPLSRGTD